MHTSVIKMISIVCPRCVSFAPYVSWNVSVRHDHQRFLACAPLVIVKGWQLHLELASLKFQLDCVNRRHGRLETWGALTGWRSVEVKITSLEVKGQWRSFQFRFRDRAILCSAFVGCGNVLRASMRPDRAPTDTSEGLSCLT